MYEFFGRSDGRRSSWPEAEVREGIQIGEDAKQRRKHMASAVVPEPCERKSHL